MENNQLAEKELAELKAYVFALYYWQNVYTEQLYTVNGSLLTAIEINPEKNRVLQLRPLSSITDAEAIYCFDMLFPNTGYTDEVKIDLVKAWVNGINQEMGGYTPKNYLYFYQYLQQQSFALPVFFKGVQYSVEDLASKGIITLLKS